MKSIFTIPTMLGLIFLGAATANAQSTDNVVFLHGENFDKANSTNNLYQFTDAEGFTLTMNNRDTGRTPCNWTDPTGIAYKDGINFKNNDPGTINIPEGYKVTKLEIGGCSQSDAGNLCYLYLADKDDVNFFTEAIGQNIKDNEAIKTAAYPILPDGSAPLFATLDFSADPATKSIKVVFSGNNQEDIWFKAYYTNTTTGIQDVGTSNIRHQTSNVYNLRGQRVNANYKGIVIKNGIRIVSR